MLRHYKSKSLDQYPLLTPESNWTPPDELPDLSQCLEVAIDTETKDDALAANYGPGWFKKAGWICGFSVAYGTRSVYIPLRDQHKETKCFDRDLVKRWLKQLASQSHTRFIFHNFSYDWGWIQATFDLPPPQLIDDTAAMASMIDENRFSFKLDDLCEWQDLPGKDERLLKEAAEAYNIPQGDLKENLWRLPGKFVGPYAEADAAQTLALARKLRPLLAAEELNNAYQIERDLMPLTLKMKQRGIRVDSDKAEQLAKKIDRQCSEDFDYMSRELKTRISIKEVRQNKWLADMFTRLGIPMVYTAATDYYPQGQPSFEKGYMAGHTHWFPRLVNKVRHQHDLAKKFLRGYICEYVHNGRIHATVNQFRSEEGGARSHRFSYADPPLQQMPSRDDEYAPLIRSCFLPEEDSLWCSIDYRQQEYRLIVFVAEVLKARGARAAADMYRNDPDTDFHNYVAEITRLPRRRAKDVNFAKSYGAGVPKFALMTGMNQAEAQKTMGQYDERLPFVREAAERYGRIAQEHGYIKLIDGARNHFNLWEPMYRDFAKEAEYRRSHKDSEFKGKGHRGIYMATSPCPEDEAKRRHDTPGHPWYGERMKRAFTHKSFNRMIQGSAARQMKKGMVDIYKAGYEPLIQIHDELGFSFINERDGKVCAEIMEQCCPIISIPMTTDTEWGDTWGTAKGQFPKK